MTVTNSAFEGASVHESLGVLQAHHELRKYHRMWLICF